MSWNSSLATFREQDVTRKMVAEVRDDSGSETPDTTHGTASPMPWGG